MVLFSKIRELPILVLIGLVLLIICLVPVTDVDEVINTTFTVSLGRDVRESEEVTPSNET